MLPSCPRPKSSRSVEMLTRSIGVMTLSSWMNSSMAATLTQFQLWRMFTPMSMKNSTTSMTHKATESNSVLFLKAISLCPNMKPSETMSIPTGLIRERIKSLPLSLRFSPQLKTTSLRSLLLVSISTMENLKCTLLKASTGDPRMVISTSPPQITSGFLPRCTCSVPTQTCTRWSSI